MAIPIGSKLVACISSVIQRELGFQDYRFVAKETVEALGIEAIRNPEDVQTQANFDEVLKADCALFILILGEVGSVSVARELRIALQRGLPIMVFIKAKRDSRGRRTSPVAAKKFLKEYCPELYDDNRIYFEDAEGLHRNIESEIEKFIIRRLQSCPIIGIDPPVAYSEGLRLLEGAKHRVVLAQKTSSFILGPRIGNSPEENFYDTMMEWLERSDKKRTFVHYFSWADTQQALGTGIYDVDAAKARVISFLQGNTGCSATLLFRADSSMNIVSHVIADTGLGLNFWIGKNRYYLFLPLFLTKQMELEAMVAAVQSTGIAVSADKLLSIYDGGSL